MRPAIADRIWRLLEVARPYWRALAAGTTWSAATTRSLRRVQWPHLEAHVGVTGEAVLLLGRWEHRRLDTFLGSVEPPWPDGEALPEVVSGLRRSTLPPDEYESWIRWLFAGNVADMGDQWWLPHLRLLHPDGAAPRVAGRAVGATGPAADLFFDPGPCGGERDMPPLHDLIPEGHPHVAAHFGRESVPAAEGNLLAALLADGWPADRISREVHDGAGDALARLAEVRFVEVGALDGWREVLTPPGMPAAHRLGALARGLGLSTLVALWRTTRLPVALQPWCAGAGLTPEEAIAMHRDGALDPEALRALTALNR